MDQFKFVDLFCGIGGFHQAMSSLGGSCVYACDIDENCRKTYEQNYDILPDGDITKVDVKQIPAHDVLCAGFPCQSFSVAGNKKGFADTTRGTLFFEILRILKFHQPKYVILENVKNLANHDSGQTWRIIKDSLVDSGYFTFEKPIIFSPHYIGIPQNRERVYILCKRKDLGELSPFFFNIINIPKCTIEKIILKDSEIENIEKFRLSKEQIEWINIWNEFIQNIVFDRIPPSFPIWADSLCNLQDNPRLQNKSNLSKWVVEMTSRNQELWMKNKVFCHEWLKKAKSNSLFYGAKSKFEWKGDPVKNLNLWDCILQIRPSGLRAKPSNYFPALVTIKTQVPIIGKQKRFLTPRECARLQSFPDSFKINENITQAYKQFGNSVNVELIRLFAKHMFGDKETNEKFSFKNQFERKNEFLLNYK